MMSTFAFAAGKETSTGTITVDNPQDGVTYTAYKIFDLAKSTAGDTETSKYTITSNDAWYDLIDEYIKSNNESDKGFTLKETATSGTYLVNVTGTTDATAANLAKFLAEKAVPAKATPITGKLENGTYTISDLSMGYYFVKSSKSTDTVCALTNAKPNATIHDKNKPENFEKKVNGKDSDTAKIGDTVNYTLSSKVPNTKGYTTYTYEMLDKMSTGLTLNASSIKVKIDNSEYDVNSSKKYVTAINTTSTGEYTFKISFNALLMNKDNLAGKDIIVEYSAIINEDAVSKNGNKATLNYSNNPTNNSTGKSTDEVPVYVGAIKITKVDGNNSDTKLEGAVFILSKNILDNNESKTLYYKETKGENGKVTKVEWIENKNSATKLTTDKDGLATFTGIETGVYQLKEVTAPAGYNALKETINITVTGENSTTQLIATSQTVENYSGTELPETGGIGTTIFYLIGAILVIGAGVVFVTRRRMHSDK